jgi:hypothetical protein
MARGRRCEAHRHLSAVPEERHHLTPLSRGGSNSPANLVWLCANAHGDAHYFLDLIERYGSPTVIPGAVRRSFGSKVRALAVVGWLVYADEFLAGRWDRHAAVWLSSGQPRPGIAAPTYAEAVRTSAVRAWIDRSLT